MRLNLNSAIDAIAKKTLAVVFIIKSSFKYLQKYTDSGIETKRYVLMFYLLIMLKLCGVVAFFQLDEFTNEPQIIDDCIFCQSFDLKLQ